MPGYWLYTLGGDGKINHSDWIDADNDEIAIELARAAKKPVSCELWKGDRLVAKIAPPKA